MPFELLFLEFVVSSNQYPTAKVLFSIYNDPEAGIEVGQVQHAVKGMDVGCNLEVAVATRPHIQPESGSVCHEVLNPAPTRLHPLQRWSTRTIGRVVIHWPEIKGSGIFD